MNKINTDCLKEEYDIFTIPVTNSIENDGIWNEIELSNNNLDDHELPLQFNVPASSDEYTQLNKTRLYLRLKILKFVNNNWIKLSATDKIGPVNLLPLAMFSSVNVSLGSSNTEFEPINTTYPWKSYIIELLNYSKMDHDSYLQTRLFEKDDAGEFNNIEIDSSKKCNNGFLKRRKYFVENDEVETITNLHVDLFNTNRNLLPAVQFSVILNKSKSSLPLLYAKNETYKIDIVKAKLLIRRIKVSPDLIVAHHLALEKATAKYPIKRTIVKTQAIEKSALDGTKTILTGILPTMVIVGFIDSEAFNGFSNKNPFEFQHFNLKSLSINIGSNAVVYAKPLEFDFKKNFYLRGYNTLFDNIDKPNIGLNISREEYPKGYSLFVFNLSPDINNNGFFNTLKSGQLNINYVFEQNLEQPINMIVYLEFDNTIEITSNRNIILDYNNS